MILSYKAAPADSGLVLPPGDSYYNAALSYTTSTGVRTQCDTAGIERDTFVVKIWCLL